MERCKKIFTTITATCAVGVFFMEGAYADSYNKLEGDPSLFVEGSGQDSEVSQESADIKKFLFKATILLEGLNVRVDKLKSSESLGYFSKGEVIDVVSDDQDGWYGVKYGDDLGYVASNYVEKVDKNVSSEPSDHPSKGLDGDVTIDRGIPFVPGDTSISSIDIENSDMSYYLDRLYFASNSFIINGFIDLRLHALKDDLIMQFTLVDSTTGVTTQTLSVDLEEVGENLLFNEKYDLDKFPIGEYFIHLQLISGGGSVNVPVNVRGALSEEFVGVHNNYALTGVEDDELYKLKIKIAGKNTEELEASTEDTEGLSLFTALWDSILGVVRRLIPFWN